MKASDLFLRCLEEQGVTTIFGVPGEENNDLMISLLNSPILFVTCRHEQDASFMADMYGRLTGKPGICLATLGPGATNLITGVTNANMDNVPLIAIIGQENSDRLHKESHQNMDAVSMYRPATKWSISIRNPHTIPEVIYKAFSIALQGKPGAVLIELPEDIAATQINEEPLPKKQTIFRYAHSNSDIEHALECIKTSNAPLLLLGFGCIQESCSDLLLQFVEKTKIYFTTTFMGKGAISDANPFSLFTVGLSMRDIALLAFDLSDLVICVGYRFVEWAPENWNVGEKKKIIHIDVAPAEVDAKYLPTTELVGNVRSILEELNTKLADHHFEDKKTFAGVREKILTDLKIGTTDDHFPMKPQRILHDLRSILSEDDIVISDVGVHKLWVARQYPTYKPKTCFIYNGFCSMGGALPGAIICKWAHPEKTVVAVCGDGAFVMSMQALITAAQYQTPIVVLIWEDKYYGLIKWKQEMTHQTHSHVDLVNPDFVDLGHALNCHAIKINHSSELKPALIDAKNATDKPSIIVIPIDNEENMNLSKRLHN